MCVRNGAAVEWVSISHVNNTHIHPLVHDTDGTQEKNSRILGHVFFRIKGLLCEQSHVYGRPVFCCERVSISTVRANCVIEQ